MNSINLGKSTELERLKLEGTSSIELMETLNFKWQERVAEQEARLAFDPNTEITDAAYFLCINILDNKLIPRLDARLRILKDRAESDGKLRDYKKTVSELLSEETNKVYGSLFEILFCGALVDVAKLASLYCSVTKSGSNVDTSAILYEREVFFECKALGHSNFDRKALYGSASINSMNLQIKKTIMDKVQKGRQLGAIMDNSPSVLVLAHGFNADIYSASKYIPSFFSNEATNLSAVLLFGSRYCKKDMLLFTNSYSSCPLCKRELEFIDTTLRNRLFDPNR